MTPQQLVPVLKTPEDIAGKIITVMGLGLNGGGLASARFFALRGARVTVTDMKDAAALAPSVEALESDPRIKNAQIKYVLGRHDISDFENADIVIKNPGVKYEGNPYLAAAKSIETDISIFLRFSRAPIIAVTGSKGKSSTASAIQYGLEQAGFSSFLGGNITVSPLTFLDETDGRTLAVLELSSWQLADLKGRGVLKPVIAVLTTVVPDHQNWYGSMEPYVADKKLIYADQDASCFTLCKYNDKWGDTFARETHGTPVRYDTAENSPLKFMTDTNGVWFDGNGTGQIRLPSRGETKPRTLLPRDTAISGSHMKENLLNAAAVLVLTGVAPEKAGDILSRFPGIPHRLEFFFEKDGVRFCNDSAATVPEAAAAALRSCRGGIYLICGGTDKQLDFEPLVREIRRARSVFLLAGTGTDKLIPLLETEGVPFSGPYESLRRLLPELKKKLTEENTGTERTVLFSPGATSFGMFDNEFHRGNVFKQAVTDMFSRS